MLIVSNYIPSWRVYITITYLKLKELNLEHEFPCDELFLSSLAFLSSFQLVHPTKLTPHFKFATIVDSSSDVNLKLTYPRMHKYMNKYGQRSLDDARNNLKNK